jgi:hypothetical protein
MNPSNLSMLWGASLVHLSWTGNAQTQIDSKSFPGFLQGDLGWDLHHISHRRQTNLSIQSGAVMGGTWGEPSLHPFRLTGRISLSCCRAFRSDICMILFI